MGETIHVLRQSIGVQPLDRGDDPPVQLPAALLEQAAVGYLVREGMLESVLRVRKEARLVDGQRQRLLHFPGPERSDLALDEFAFPDIRDAAGVPLAPGQRVVYAAAGFHATGHLRLGTLVRARRVAEGPSRERIVIRRDDGRVVTLSWAKRVLVLPESEPERSLRQQLATLSQ